jgi:hypothetical protein
MAGQYLEWVPLDAVEVIEDGEEGLLAYMERVSWEPPPAPAFLVVDGRLGQEGARYYLFNHERFVDLAAQMSGPSPVGSGAMPASSTPVYRAGEQPSEPGVVIDPAGTHGVWIEAPERILSAAPPPDEDLSWAVPADGGGAGGAAPSEAMAPPPPPATAPPPPPAPAPPPPTPQPAPAPSARSAPGAPASRSLPGETANGGRRGRTFEPPAARGIPREAEPEPSPEPDVEQVSRTPHLDLSDDAPAPGARFTATVYADTEATREGEQSTAIDILATPDVRQFALRVWLTTTSDLEVEEPNDLPLVINRDQERSTEAQFRVRVSPQAKPGGTASITALFVYQGRPCGHVMRNVGIGTAPELALTAVAPPALRVDTRAAVPDLTIQVTAAPDNNGQKFLCRVTTPLVPGGEEQSPAAWNLPAASSTLVVQYMGEFTKAGISNAQRRAALVGAGKLLFNAAPDNFKKTFWELVDRGTLPESIYVVSQEPYVPWELMIPHRLRPDGTREQRPPLGVEFAVGRWVSDVPLSPVQQLKVTDAWVVAPTYRGRDVLANSAAEAQLLNQLFGARTITPALYANLDAVFGSAGMSLLHFICHGVAGGGGVQTIKLDPDETLSSLMLMGMSGAGRFQESQPMVFLNACEIGRPEPALVGVEGFAKSFIALGARCVIAPLWSVKDSIAHQVATEFYQRMSQEPGLPLAAILRDIRRKAYEEDGGEDTYAAYTFYGDPLAAKASA